MRTSEMIPAAEAEEAELDAYWEMVNWGVNFMQANEGIEPDTSMISYFSELCLGPDLEAINDRFGLEEYKQIVSEEWQVQEQERQQTRREKFASLRSEMSAGEVPAELFFPPCNRTEHGAHNGMASSELLQSPDEVTDTGLLAESVVLVIPDPAETLRLRAEFLVLGSLLETISPGVAIQACRRLAAYGEYKNFHPTVNRYFSKSKTKIALTDGDIEHEALILEVFDDIWPMNDHIKTLRLDEGYHEYIARKKVAFVEA